jgi:hypothetical protein
MSAAQALAAVQSAITGATSVSYSYTTAVTGQGTAASTGSAGASSGYQVNHFPTGTLSVLVSNGDIYCMGDAGSLENQLGLSAQDASTYAGRWISLAPSDPPAAAVGSGVSLPDVESEILGTSTNSTNTSPSGITLIPESVSAPHVFNGVNVVTISISVTVAGSAAGTATGGQGSAQLDVAAQAPYLPVSESLSASIQGPSGPVTATSTVTLSGWNAPLSLPTPTNVVLYASIPSAQ